MDISELVAAGQNAGEYSDQVAVPAGLEAAVQDYMDRADPLGAGVTAEERQAMLERNFPDLTKQQTPAPVAPVIPTPAPAPIPAPTVQAAPIPQPAPVPQGPSPEQIALLELVKSLKEDIAAARKPPEKSYEQMDPVERLQYDLVQQAKRANEEQLTAVQAELRALREHNERLAREQHESQQALMFQNQVVQNVQGTLFRPDVIDPEFVTRELVDEMTELGLTAAAGYQEDAQKATARIARMFNAYNTALQKTQMKRVAPQVQRTAALPVPVPTGQPAVGLPRRAASNADVQKYYNGDRFAASMDGYRKVPAGQ